MQNVFLGLYSLNTERAIGSIEADIENVPTKDQEEILRLFRIVFPKYQWTTVVAFKQA